MAQRELFYVMQQLLKVFNFLVFEWDFSGFYGNPRMWLKGRHWQQNTQWKDPRGELWNVTPAPFWREKHTFHLSRHLKFHLKSKQDIEKRKGVTPESPNFIETSIFNGEQGHRWTVNKLNLASYKIPGCQLLNKKLIYHAIDLGDCVKNAFKWSDLLVIWVLFYTTVTKKIDHQAREKVSK